LQALAFGTRDTRDGCLFQLQLNVPEPQRKGLFKIVAAEAKECDPPPFVPADAVKFYRWRLDLQKAWSGLTNTLTEMFPPASGVIKLLLESAGKDLDLAFDARTNLIGNLGDDLISFARNPRTNTLSELKSPPRILLVGARNADQLAASLRAVTSILPTDSTQYHEWEFLGRKVYSMTVPNVFQSDMPVFIPGLTYAAMSNYVVFANSAGALEDYLQSTEATGKSLREMTGLPQAAQKAGGMRSGLFGFDNQRESLRTVLELLKQEP